MSEAAHKPIVNIADLEMKAVTKGTRFAYNAGRIGAVIGMKQLGAQYMVVPPGKSAFPSHAHFSNEELFVILEGSGRYRKGEEGWEVRAGDVISAPGGSVETAHQLTNTGTVELKYLSISTRHDPDVTFYGDSDKLAVAAGIPEGGGMRAASCFFIGRAGDTLDYWDGEDIGDDK